MPTSTIVTMETSPFKASARAKVDLIAWDPESPAHIERMFQQRVACGWKQDHVENWRGLQREGKMTLQWVVSCDFLFIYFSVIQGLHPRENSRNTRLILLLLIYDISMFIVKCNVEIEDKHVASCYLISNVQNRYFQRMIQKRSLS